MNLFHLSAIILLALNFTGRPVSRTEAAPVSEEKVAMPVHETEEYIAWTSDRLLTWDDFKCTRKTGTDAVASPST